VRSKFVRAREATKVIVKDIVKGDLALVEITILILILNFKRFYIYTNSKGA